MKADRLFDMMECIDDVYVLEAAPKTAKHSRTGKQISAVLIAAAVSVSMLAACKLIFHRDGVRQFYTESAVVQLESGGHMLGITTENAHLRITVDSFVRDDYRAFPILTAEALDSAGAALLRQNELAVSAAYADTGETADEYVQLLWTVPYTEGQPLTMRGCIFYRRGNKTIDLLRPLRLTFSAREADTSLFDGLTAELPVGQPVKSVTLFTAEGEELYLSEIGFAALVDVGKTAWDYSVEWKDGTTTRAAKTGSEGDGLCLENSSIGMLVNFNCLIDPGQVAALTIGGKRFERQE